jgi:MFS family permease
MDAAGIDNGEKGVELLLFHDEVRAESPMLVIVFSYLIEKFIIFYLYNINFIMARTFHEAAMKELSRFNHAVPPSAAIEPASGTLGAAGTSRKIGPAQAVAAITIGNALEFFDFTVYSFLAVTLGELFFPVSTAYGQLLLSTATFGVGFVTRPIGGIVLGTYADRAGRKAAMLVTLTLMALGSGMIAFAPTYAQIGIAAPAIIVLARLVQGFSAGGEVGATTAILLEYATPRTRSFYSSWQFASQGLGVAIGALLSAASARYLDHDDFLRWGWRIPFVIGILVAPMGLYIRNRLEDTIQPRATRASAGVAPSPLRIVLRDHWRVIYPAFAYLNAAPSTPRLLLVVGVLITLHVLSMTSMAIVPSLLPKDIRATGSAFIYAIGVVVVGGSSQFITTWLVHATGSKMSPALYLLVCTAITVAALIKIEDRSANQTI